MWERAGRGHRSRSAGLGRKLWRAILADYDLSPGELALLAEAAKTADVIARIDGQLAAIDDLVSVGSAGQPRPHPLLAADGRATALQDRFDVR
jgi:hypothetical protein